MIKEDIREGHGLGVIYCGEVDVWGSKWTPEWRQATPVRSHMYLQVSGEAPIGKVVAERRYRNKDSLASSR